MLIVGPRLTAAPLPTSSLPTTWPYWPASDGSKVAASATPAGSWVTPVSPSADAVGPVLLAQLGMHRLGIPAM